MRLIYADDFLSLFYTASMGQDKELIKTVEMVVEDTPIIDAEPVVHCNDCAYFKWGDYCTQDKMEHSKCRPDDFCSYAKRKTDGDSDD